MAKKQAMPKIISMINTYYIFNQKFYKNNIYFDYFDMMICHITQTQMAFDVL